MAYSEWEPASLSDASPPISSLIRWSSSWTATASWLFFHTSCQSCLDLPVGPAPTMFNIHSAGFSSSGHLSASFDSKYSMSFWEFPPMSPKYTVRPPLARKSNRSNSWNRMALG